MASLSDRSHMDTCAGRWCNTIEERAKMHRVPGKRGYWCERCYAFQQRLAANLPKLEEPDLLEKIKRGLRT